jgi:hypothetical protein
MNDSVPMTRSFIASFKEKVSRAEAELKAGCPPFRQEEILADIAKSEYYIGILETVVERAEGRGGYSFSTDEKKQFPEIDGRILH